MKFNLFEMIKNIIRKIKGTKKLKEPEKDDFEENLNQIRERLRITLEDTTISNDKKSDEIKEILIQLVTISREKKFENGHIMEKSGYGDEYDFIEAYFKDDSQIQNAIKIARESKIYAEITDIINSQDKNKTIWEIYDKFDRHYARPFKTSNIDETFKRIVSLIENYSKDEVAKKNMIDIFRIKCVDYVIEEIRNCTDITEKIELTKKFLGFDIMKTYREIFWERLNDKDIENRIFLEKKGVKIAGKDKCPKLLKVIDRKTLLENNDKLAQEKLRENNGEIKEDDLAFVRLVEEDRISYLGVLEPIGQFSEPRKTKSFFDKAIEEAYPNENEKDFEQLTIENRQTVHFTVNGLVTDHFGNKFSDGNVIYILSWEDLEDKAVNLLSADSYIKGSTKAKTALMSIQSYKKLTENNEEIKKEFDRLNIVLFDEEEIKNEMKKYITDEDEIKRKINQYALELYLNSQNKVFGEVSTQHYNFTEGKYIEPYLKNVENKLKSLSKQKGITYDTHMDTEQYNQDTGGTMRNRRNEIELFVKIIKDEASSYLGKEFDYQQLLKMLGYLKGVGYKDDEGNVYYDQEDLEDRKKRYTDTLVEFLKKIPPEKFKEIIKKYNEEMMKRYKVARKEKDEEYLREGLITQKDFNERYGKEEEHD